jgi:hypothetical protein
LPEGAAPEEARGEPTRAGPVGGTSAAAAPAWAAGTVPVAPALAGLDALGGAAALVEQGLPFDAGLVRQSLDTFLGRLAHLAGADDELPGWARPGPWLAFLTAAALVLARRWARPARPDAAPDDETHVLFPEDGR